MHHFALTNTPPPPADTETPRLRLRGDVSALQASRAPQRGGGGDPLTGRALSAAGPGNFLRERERNSPPKARLGTTVKTNYPFALPSTTAGGRLSGEGEFFFPCIPLESRVTPSLEYIKDYFFLKERSDPAMPTGISHISMSTFPKKLQALPRLATLATSVGQSRHFFSQRPCHLLLLLPLLPLLSSPAHPTFFSFLLLSPAQLGQP